VKAPRNVDHFMSGSSEEMGEMPDDDNGRPEGKQAKNGIDGEGDECLRGRASRVVRSQAEPGNEQRASLHFSEVLRAGLNTYAQAAGPGSSSKPVRWPGSLENAWPPPWCRRIRGPA